MANQLDTRLEVLLHPDFRHRFATRKVCTSDGNNCLIYGILSARKHEPKRLTPLANKMPN
jgi:hypothetical protein